MTKKEVTIYGQKAKYLGKRKAATPGYEVHMYKTGKHSSEDVITKSGQPPPHVRKLERTP